MTLYLTVTNKGAPSAHYLGYSYRKKTVKSDGCVVWICKNQQVDRCTATIVTREDHVIRRPIKEHVCGEPDEAKLEMTRRIQDAKQRVRQGLMPIGMVYQDTVQSLQEDQLESNEENIRRALQRHRQKGLEGDERVLRTKWKSLRDNFRQEIKKIPKHTQSEDGSLTSYVPSWAHFPKLTFLTEQMSLRQPYLLNVMEQMEGSNPEVSLEVSDDTSVRLDDADQPTNGKQSLKRKSTATAFSADKRHCNIPTEIVEENFSFYDDNSNHEINDDYHFFMSLLPYFRSLPRPKAMLLRMRMQEMVYKELYSSQPDVKLEN